MAYTFGRAIQRDDGTWTILSAPPASTSGQTYVEVDVDGVLTWQAESGGSGDTSKLSWKTAVRAASTANGTLASAFENGDTLDGVTLATGDRILLKNQSAPAENGIYTVNASGAPTRATDNDEADEFVDAAVFVSEGTANADTAWICSTNAPITVGSTSLTWVQFGAGATYSADESTLHLAGTTFSVKAGGVGTTELATNAVTTAKIADANVTDAKVSNRSACSVFGRSANSTGVGADIAIGANDEFLVRRSNTVVADVLLVTDVPNAIRDIRSLPIIDGGGAVITVGSKGMLEMPAGTLVAARLYGDQASGTLEIDLRRTTYANYAPGTHPVSGDSIIGAGTALKLNAAAKYEDVTFTSWTSVTFVAGDILEVVVTGTPATHSRVTLVLVIRRT